MDPCSDTNIRLLFPPDQILNRKEPTTKHTNSEHSCRCYSAKHALSCPQFLKWCTPLCRTNDLLSAINMRSLLPPDQILNSKQPDTKHINSEPSCQRNPVTCPVLLAIPKVVHSAVPNKRLALSYFPTTPNQNAISSCRPIPWVQIQVSLALAELTYVRRTMSTLTMSTSSDQNGTPRVQVVLALAEPTGVPPTMATSTNQEGRCPESESAGQLATALSQLLNPSTSGFYDS